LSADVLRLYVLLFI